MQRKWFIGSLVALATALGLLADGKFPKPNAKLGLWEMTTTIQMAGLPPLPPDVLAKMPPETRARMEAMMKGRGAVPQTVQSCVTQEKLDKWEFSDQPNKSCERKIINATSSLVEFTETCTDSRGMKREIQGRFESLDSTHMKGSAKSTASDGGRTINVNVDISGKWISSDCGDKAGK